jgi:transposase-like protein
MNTLRLMLVFAIVSSVGAQDTSKYAPLPDKVAKAKTVFFLNDTANSRFGDDMYQELKKWNHWQVVTDRSKADLIFVLSQRESVDGLISTGTATATGNAASGTVVTAPVKTSSWYIYLVDPNGETLWTTRHTLGGRLWQSWGSVARSLLSDIQKRMK